MVKFTDEELSILYKIAKENELVNRLMEDYTRLTLDNSAELRAEWNEIRHLIATDLKYIRENKNFNKCVLITNAGEDKGLERILKLSDKLDVIAPVSNIAEPSSGKKKDKMPEM